MPPDAVPGQQAPTGDIAPTGSAENPVQTPWAGVEGVYNIGEGDAAKPWWSNISEPEIREYMDAKQYANPEQAARAAWSANKLNKGASDAVIIPGENATPDEVSAFHSKLGRPDAADKYDFKFEEGVKVDEGLMKFGKELFFDLGASPAMAQKAMDKWNAHMAEMTTTNTETDRVANDTALAALTTKWGPELDANKAAGQRVLDALKLDTKVADAIAGAMGLAPMVEFLAAIGKASAEPDGLTTGNISTDPNDATTMTVDQAKARIELLQADKEFQEKYNDAKNPGHKNALDIMQKLFARAG